ncbi:MAG: hypothetical protein KDB27_30175, partial [Planctomycetales bacterium]|nr:hypothetical protein [Planctomycetales bacterium]
GAEPASLHRVLSSWGEASSDAGEPGGAGAAAEEGDATWLHRRYLSSNWNQPGGDFVSQSSGTIDINTVGDYAWSTQQMVTDIEFWRDNPNQNFGWLIQGNETERKTAKRLDSRENSVAANRPVLTIEYEDPVVLPTASISNASIAEGSGSSDLVFSINLTEPVPATATVSVSTADGSAIAVEDYVAQNTTLTIEPGDGTALSFAVPIVGDNVVEDDETFTVRLSSPNGIVLGTATATGTILNDDEEAAVSKWHNLQIPEDTSGDGLIVPRDALLIINVLNGAGMQVNVEEPLENQDTELPAPPYIDVNGDGFVSPIDALQVINWLNNNDVVGQAAQPRTASPASHQRSIDQAVAALDRFDEDEFDNDDDDKRL